LGALFLALLVSATAGTMADDGERVGQPPKIDLEPVVLERVESADGKTAQVTVEIPVSADTYIASNQPNTNYGNTTWLRLGYNATGDNLGALRILLYVNVGSIPSNAQIHWARFRIYQHSVTLGSSDPNSVTTRHLNSSWDERTVTWNQHQPDWGGVINKGYPTRAIGWIEADTTDLVKEWVSGQHANHGLTFLADEGGVERQRMLYSREQGGGYHPRMVVNYTEHVDTEPPRVSVESLPTWSPQRFVVKWSGDDPGGSGIDYYDVRYRIPGTNWINWLNNTRNKSAEFVGGANGTTYEFQARGVDKAGNVQQWPSNAQASTKVDSIAPTASVNALPPVIFSNATWVSWTGSDNSGGSGIKNYDIQWREAGGSWQDWLKETTKTTEHATGGVHGKTYEFRARARDVAGNVQSWSSNAQAQTTVDTLEPKAWIEPFSPPIVDAGSFVVRWNAETSPNVSLKHYDVRYQIPGGPWTIWQPQTTSTQATFSSVGADGRYCFQARATDTQNRTGPYSEETCVFVDRDPPYMELFTYLPIITHNRNMP
jgi:hypothetical protein